MTRRIQFLLPFFLVPALAIAGCADKGDEAPAANKPSAAASAKSASDARGITDSPNVSETNSKDGKEGGTGTRAKGEVGALATSAPGSEDPNEPSQEPAAVAPAVPTAQSPRGIRGGAKGRDGKKKVAGVLPRKRPQDGFGGPADGDGRTEADDGRADNERGYRQGLLDEDRQPSGMTFENYGVNPTIDTAEEGRSTFAVDVDTASFTMARSYLERGIMPDEASVRVEELVNAFDYNYAPPRDETFSVHAEAAPSPNRRGYHILHLGLKGKEIAASQRKAANLVFVVDVSGSMDSENRLGLVKRSLRLLVDQLGESDKVGIVTYGTNAKELLQPTSAYNKAKILQVIDGLSTEGATNAEAGLKVGYRMASRNMRTGGVNRVILCSDGVANVGTSGPNGLLATIKREAKRGITISTVGFGMGNYNDVVMERLANGGDGNYHYVDKLAQARKVFVEQLTGTLQVLAKDAKIQVDFNKDAVSRYRLIGYENRSLKAHQFNDDRVDAGELGAGHSVTAIYEVRLREGSSGPLGKVRIRFKQPNGNTSQLVEKELARTIVKGSPEALSSPSQLSLVAAQFAEKLRGSYWARNVSYDDILRRFDRIASPMRERADVVELRKLVRKARDLDRRGDKFEPRHGPVAKMTFDRVPVLR